MKPLVIPFSVAAISRVSTAGLLCIVGTAASAQVVFCSDSPISLAFISTFHGYSNKPADPGAPGTSTIVSSSSTQTHSEFNPATERCEVVGTKHTTSENYTDGPGNSPYENRNPISASCEATGTLSCP
jgi:hypothetical protein